MKHKKQNAFTLVELIVVITILAILGTIAFISLQGYSKSSRDSSRISDISSMKTSLELFQIDAGKYPVPTEGVDVTYSGAVVWNQGTFGEITFTNVAKLDRIPTDPLTDSVYTYSVTSTRNKYQIGGILEGDPLALNTFETANAGTVEGTALISGTYNGQATKTLTGTTCDMLAVPSIIANDLSETTDVVNLINSGSIAYNGFKNLPNSFKSSKFKHDG
ncbi:MAG: type II secretion system protein [Candidatus Gracilibacteria bacterium]|nr:type II secretion system protein [Candidatus Gracilibacteria bacterium]